MSSQIISRRRSKRTDMSLTTGRNSSITWTVSMFGFFRRLETLKNLKQASIPTRKQNHLFTWADIKKVP